MQLKTPVECINHTAPDVKNGRICPEKRDFNEAVELLLDNPILTKRSLVRVDIMYIRGFTDTRLRPYLGDWDGTEDVNTCPNLATLSCDDQRRL